MGAKRVANAEKVVDAIKLGSRIVGDGGAMLLSGGQALEAAKQVYTNITNGEGLTWKNLVDVITLGVSIAGMGMAGASIAKSGKSLKAMYKGKKVVSNVATSNATKGVSQARENAGHMKMDLQMFGGKSGSASDELIHVYRGTDKYSEIVAFKETGRLMSDATRNLYFETGNLNTAYAQSSSIHESWLKIWENENDYVQAHGAFGTELSQAFGLDRTFMSVTTDPEVARRFAGTGGQVFEAYIPKSQLIKQTLGGAGESEYLIRFGSGGFK